MRPLSHKREKKASDFSRKFCLKKQAKTVRGESMKTAEKIIQHMREREKREGSTSNLLRILETSKNPVYRAISEGKLPNGENLCAWLDALNAQVVFPGEELDDFSLVPRVEARAGAGGAAYDISSKIEGLYAFRSAFLASIAVSPQKAVMMEVVGDSMEPLIRERDTLLVDTADNQPREGHIYVLSLDGGVVVKRMQKIPNGWALCSENNNYSPVHVQGQELESIGVIGRVRWFGRVL